jgi:hypothetical protein
MTNRESEILEDFKENYRAGTDSHKAWHDEDAEMHAIYAGHQWDAKDVAALEAEHRPALVFNAVMPVVNAVSGSEITNRTEPRFIPRTVSDSEFNDVVTETVRYQRQQADTNYEKSAVFRDAVIAGIGCMEFSYDYSESEYGQLVTERVPMGEVEWDPSSKKMNLVDARWVMRGKWIPEREFENIWGREALDNVKAAASEESMPISGQDEIHNQTLSNLYASDMKFYDSKQRKVAVFDYQWIEVEKYFIVTNLETGEKDYLSRQQKRDMEETLEAIPEEDRPLVDVQEMPKKVYYRAFIAGDVVLEHGESRIQRNFTYKFVTGFMDQKEDRVEWFGLMRSMKDPQSWSNKMVSQIIHVIATNPKGAIIAEEGVFKNPAQAMQDWAKPNPLITTRMKALQNKEVQIIEGKYPHSMERMMDISLEAIPRVSGVNPYMSGQIDDLKRTAQSAVQLVQRSGMVILSNLFDSLGRFTRECGRLHLAFIDAYMEEGTVVRIAKDPLDPQGEPVEFKRDWIEKVEYDVVVDEAPISPTANEDFWRTLMQTDAFGTLVERGMLTMDIVADIMPNVPTSIRQRMKENYRQMLQQQQAMMQQQQAAQQQAPPQ